jgi:tetratricopeptide (TPR) repeat protein
MTNKRIAVVAMLTFLVLVVAIGITPTSAQQPTPTPSAPSIPTPNLEPRILDLESKVVQLEVVQTHFIESLNSSNEQYKFLLIGFGSVLGALVVIQSIVNIVQLRREGKRDQLEHAGVNQVSEIMKVVRDTLYSRLTAEQEARKEAIETREELERVLGEVKSLDRFYKNFQTTIRNTRQTIEDNAYQLAQVPRHSFRPIVNELNSFARQFDTFKSQFEALEEEPHPFSAKPLYIRGIAAHYANQPEIAKPYLTEVTGLRQPDPGDTEKGYKRRVANAYYYLGITELNFGNAQNAIDSFDNANSLDPDGTDFLTKIVTAEAYIMRDNDDFDQAQQILAEVEEGLRRKRDRAGRLTGVYLRLRSRTILIEANMAILMHEADSWNEVKDLLEMVRRDDPTYYYATATLAQIYIVQDEYDDAQRLFREAYENIERSGDLLTISEARSQILLRMVAGLCCQQGLRDERRAEEHLDRADSLRSSLPKIDSQICTVFSALSKRNERSEIIHDHIELIRKGKVLLEANS